MIEQLQTPAPYPKPFLGGIRHPELFLWDAWSYIDKGQFHLYCLAINRHQNNGEPLCPKERNNYGFHIRHFVSRDQGLTWEDKGQFQQAGVTEEGHESRNIWSGSILVSSDKTKLAAYTGIQENGDARPFLQNLAVATSYCGSHVDEDSHTLLLCPLRDENAIRSSGYFISEPGSLGSKYGEDNGPILAWRDPFIFENKLQKSPETIMLWAAKASPFRPAVGWATLKTDKQSIEVTAIKKPIELPDSNQFSQIELPKIYCDQKHSRYLMVTATTTRQSELQRDDEVEKCIRIYTAESIDGPWQKGGRQTSKVSGLDNLFGMTVLDADFEKEKLLCIAPYTEAASSADALSFAPVFEIDISGLNETNQVKAIQSD